MSVEDLSLWSLGIKFDFVCDEKHFFVSVNFVD